MCIEYGYVYLNIILFHSEIFRALGKKKKKTTTKKQKQKKLEKKRKEKSLTNKQNAVFSLFFFPLFTKELADTVKVLRSLIFLADTVPLSWSGLQEE